MFCQFLQLSYKVDVENDELGESRTTLRRTCGILGPCPLLREKPIIIIIIIIIII